jgi:hypothetical protein
MHFKQPLIQTQDDYVFHLAPIPVYQRIFDDVLTDKIYQLGLETLTDTQKRMGQELPQQYDEERQSQYGINYDRQDQWVEDHEFPPIGSRFFTPPNDFLDNPDEDVQVIRRRIEGGFLQLLKSIQVEVKDRPTITESWLQYYDPYSGRGHNAHNHCRWHHKEAKPIMLSGGYYLSDGNPIQDHPYSGVFSFHIRGMKYYIRPKKGMLIIWPYDIIHSVEPFYGKEHRAVINFNIQVG